MQAALRATFGEQKVQEEVSGYYIANEVRITMEGFLIATKPDDLIPFQTMTPNVLAAELLRCAANVRLPKYKRHPRGPKTPVPARTRFRKHTHVFTARLLKESPARDHLERGRGTGCWRLGESVGVPRISSPSVPAQ